MTDERIQNLIDMNYRALTLLGIATSIICNNKNDESEWFLKAVNSVVYLNKPLPELPKPR